MKKGCLVVIFSLIGLCSSAQNLFEPSDTLNKKRVWTVGITEGLSSIGSIAVLYQTWYKQYSNGSFHTFNDNQQWLQMDKVGHATTSYYVGYAGIEALNWAGVESKKSALFGGGLGLVYLTGLEIMDGYSSNWGFSSGDMIANLSGSALAIGQELAWQEQRIQLKVSAHHTQFANFRPSVLGSGNAERLLKDYNGQTYWLSANISQFLPESSRFPKWLNVAVGYGGEEMISGSVDPDTYCHGDSWCQDLNRYRQFYLSLDVDLKRLPIKSKFLKTVFGSIGFIKIPFPTLEFNKSGLNFHPLYF